MEHQIEREIDAIYNQQRMHELIEVMQFTAYYNRNKNYFLVAAGKQESKSLFDRLARSSPPINTVPGRVDLNKLSEMGPTTGGWFGNLKVQEVSSAALFGTEMVVESPEWARNSKVGKISALNMRIADSLGSTRAVMVTQDRLVLLMKDYGENQNLMFVAYVNDLIEELGAGTVPASANKPSGE